LREEEGKELAGGEKGEKKRPDQAILGQNKMHRERRMARSRLSRTTRGLPTTKEVFGKEEVWRRRRVAQIIIENERKKTKKAEEKR